MKKLVILSLGLLLSSCIYEGKETWIILSNQPLVNGISYEGTKNECTNFIKKIRYSTFINIKDTTLECVSLEDLP